ncbi:uncharacterized protein LOC110446237 [Mizuhopecten yessoensis]|uniref:uncharacterized protein LOC110446237 n=1 Tax=Mizuhopecten yessoensis TaxID=6573 RepID=UPI000B459E05|nr:uncharacterized protein LOC110446237 [Mizuhopecten yessoensis]
MSSLQDLIARGREMKYEGEALQKFVSEQQAQERDEREKERTFRFEMEKKNLLLEQAKIEAEREVRAEARMEQEHKWKLEILQAGGGEEKPSTLTPRDSSMKRGPKLPAFDETRDNMDAYLQRFERYAEAQRWERGNWGANLSALLRGKALDVFSRLPVEKALDFDELKNALLLRFEMTEEGFRKSFRTARPEGGETFSQFATRLQSYAERWIELSKTEKNYEKLRDLMLRDQFIHCCGQDLSLFLKERTPSSITAMAKLADQFVEARGTKANQVISRGQKSGSSKLQSSSPADTSTSKPSAKDRKCYNCGKPGHLSYECRAKKNGSGHKVAAIVEERHGKETEGDLTKACKKKYRKPAGSEFHNKNDLATLSMSCDVNSSRSTAMPVVKGCAGKYCVTVLRDTGCSGVVVRKCLVDKDSFTDRVQVCTFADGSRLETPIAIVEVDSPYFRGTTEAWALETPLYDLIIGNIYGALPPDQPDKNWKMKGSNVQTVETRAQMKKKGIACRPLKVPDLMTDIGNVEDLKEEQQKDPTLEKFRKLASAEETYERDDGGSSTIFYKKGVMYRKFKSPRVRNGMTFRQLIVPEKYREMVMRLAHESIMSGHLAAKRTTNRVLWEFFWPGVQAEVIRFCKSCDICQRTFPKGRVPKAPLGDMPLIDTPFKRIAVDLIGPLEPATERGNRYILTVVDYATRYPEAVALKSIETERVAEALIDIFSRVGIPSEMLTDQGAQFTSELMREVSRLLSIRQLTTSPYHPMCNGLVERFNGTLKQMLRKMSAERPKDWDRFINALLFAYREVPQESLGFSPFELLYGRAVRGPMMILRELMTKDIPDEEVKTTYQYVMDLRERIEETCSIAADHLKDAKFKQKKYFNRRARQRNLKAGDKVLVLLPTKANKLLMQWRGPYEVVEKVGPSDYRVNRDGKVKVLHINLLKKYEIRRKNQQDLAAVSIEGAFACVMSMVIDEDEIKETDFNQVLETIPCDKGKEGIEDVEIADSLSQERRSEVQRLLTGYKDVLTDHPGRTVLAEHDIVTTTTEPVHVKPYPLPFNTKEVIKKEVDKMLEMGVIEPSSSPYSAPVVIVKKKDGTNRFCIDFRRLNRVTVFDAEPMPNTEDIFSRLAGARFFSRLDLSKGYWQVPMSDKAKPMTAFATPQGLFQFRVMPFGLVNAPATFSRMMRKLLAEMKHLENFIDDILIYTSTWEKHLDVLKELFSRLRNAGLTARPSKCALGFGSLSCLGHVVGLGGLELEQSKVKAIEEAPRPVTKKQVRSFLGLAGFYRKFIPNFAAISVPLTDLTKKGGANKVVWGESQEIAFNTLKKMLTAGPVLKLADLEQDFILRTDASDTGLGAVLLQEDNDKKLPVAYASKKLLPRERNYAIVEKECLAIVWGIQKFEPYLYGREFILETDHQPLTYLHRSRTANARLMRWALLLQPYRFRIRAIKGVDNVGADYLSRI